MFSLGLYRQPKLSGAPDDTDGLSPKVTSYSRTCSWEKETYERPLPPHFRTRLNSSFLSHPDLLADDRLASVEDLLSLNIDVDAYELRHDLSVKSVDARRIVETAAEAVKVASMSNASGM